MKTTNDKTADNYNNRRIPRSMLFDPLTLVEEKKLTLKLYNLRKQIKEMKRNLRKNPMGQNRIEMEKAIALLKNEYENCRDAMILANTRLVACYAINLAFGIGQVGSARFEANDLFSEGIIGLRNAISRFNPHRKNRFATYATYWIRMRIQRYAQRNMSEVCAPHYIHERVRKFMRLDNETRQDLMESSDDKKIIDAVGLDAKTLIHGLSIIYPTCVRLNHPIGEDNDLAANEVVPDDGISPDGSAENRDTLEKMIETMETLFWALKSKELAVLRKRIGCNGREWTLQEIADEIDLTRERVRQIEEIAWSKIKARASRLSLEGRKAPYPDLLKIIPKQPDENLLKFCRQLYLLHEEQVAI